MGYLSFCCSDLKKHEEGAESVCIQNNTALLQDEKDLEKALSEVFDEGLDSESMEYGLEETLEQLDLDGKDKSHGKTCVFSDVNKKDEEIDSDSLSLDSVEVSHDIARNGKEEEEDSPRCAYTR